MSSAEYFAVGRPFEQPIYEAIAEHLAGMEPLNHPSVFACLGMVIGLYGILYLEVARVPERGWLIAAIGLTGKFLGPIGWSDLVLRGVWPASRLRK